MTTLRIEVGRRSGTTVEQVVAGLRMAGVMKDLEIDPGQHQWIPIEELTEALLGDLVFVELVPWPAPPPLPLWRRIRALPYRAYLWARRVVLRESYTEQFLRASMPSDTLASAMTRECPMLRKLRGDE